MHAVLINRSSVQGEAALQQQASHSSGTNSQKDVVSDGARKQPSVVTSAQHQYPAPVAVGA